MLVEELVSGQKNKTSLVVTYENIYVYIHIHRAHPNISVISKNG